MRVLERGLMSMRNLYVACYDGRKRTGIKAKRPTNFCTLNDNDTNMDHVL